MDDYDFKQKTPEKEDQAPILSEHREYIIKIDEKNKYILRLELKQKYIYFIFSSEDQLGYNYKTSMDLSTIVNKLELNPSKFNKLELILKLFNQIYENNKISIKINNDEYCSLIIKLIQASNEENYEIKLYKHYMNPDDKFKIMFNLIKELKNENIDIKNEMNNKINKLNEIIQQKDKIINEMNSKLLNQGNKIEELDKKILTLNTNYNNTKEEITKENNLIVNQSNIINENKNYLANKIDEDYYAFHNEINLLKEIINQVNEKLKENPKNLRFKANITTVNTPYGWNDMSEIFTSKKDNKEYLVSPNANNFHLDIFDLSYNKLVNSLPGHNNQIRNVRYNNNYLISADDDKIVIVWDINNNYKIIHKIKTNYGGSIYSCLLFFNGKDGQNNYNNYIITSTFNYSGNDEDSATKIYSFNNGKWIRNINRTNNISIYYLLSWKNNNNYYIIQFASGKIIISNLLTDKLYAELINQPEADHYNGFIYYGAYQVNNINVDLLFSSSYNGYINIWNLYEKKIFKVIDTNGCLLSNIILWNNQYLIASDFNNMSFKIIDMENNSFSNMKTNHKDKLVCIKKINHPIFGQALLSAAIDRTIKLWT